MSLLNVPSVPRRLLAMAGLYLPALVLLLALAYAGLEAESAFSAAVRCAGLWSADRSEAVDRLEGFAAGGRAQDYRAYRQAISRPVALGQALAELKGSAPSAAIVRASLHAAHAPEQELESMVDLLLILRKAGFLQRALSLWSDADQEIQNIVASGDLIQKLIATRPGDNAPDTQRSAAIDAALAHLADVDQRAGQLEEQFIAMLAANTGELRLLLRIMLLCLGLSAVGLAIVLSARLLRQHDQVARALRISQEHLNLAVRNGNQGIWNWNPHTDALYLSQLSHELLDVPAGELPTPSALLENVHAKDREAARTSVQAALRDTTPLELEVRFRARDGGYRWVQVLGRALRHSDGSVDCLAGSIRDISELKRGDALRRQIDADERRRSECAQIALLEQIQGKIGRELHDDLGQQLTGVAFLAKALEQRLSAASPAERDQTSWIVRLINGAIDRVRFMSRQLSPIEIDEVSLGTALTRLVEDVRAIFGTRIALRMDKHEACIPRQRASQFFRIAQEAISNALRHGQATQIVIRLDAWETAARLAIVDNGCGFPVRRVDVGASLGLRSMAIRAETLQGKLCIRSGARGTVVIVRAGNALMAGEQPELRKIA